MDRIALGVSFVVALRNERHGRGASRVRLTGSSDLWSACTARAADMPITTRNAEHFERVPGVEVEVVPYATQDFVRY